MNAATGAGKLPKTAIVLGRHGRDFADRQGAQGGPAMPCSPDRDPGQSRKAFNNIRIAWIR